MELPKLNFSENFDFKLKKNKDKIFIYDPVRKNWFLLTPEEWVRQHWIHYFLNIKNYASSALIVEKKIEIDKVTKRLDLLITEKTKPIILIECKAPKIKLTMQTFEQTARYNAVVGAEEIILTNGMHHIFAKFTDNNYVFEQKDF